MAGGGNELGLLAFLGFFFGDVAENYDDSFTVRADWRADNWTKIRFSELVNRNNLSLWVGWFFDKDWAIGFSRSSTSFPSEVTSFKTLFQLSPSASPWSQPIICWADGFISSMLPSLEIARTPSSMALITTSDLLQRRKVYSSSWMCCRQFFGGEPIE